MELFPAADEEQWEFIRRVIDDCDYYILIIGGRYGSLTADGINYTEKEYDYAVGIGLKVLAFVHESPEEIPIGKSDIDPELRAKLDSFRSKVSSNRLVKFWKSAEELPGIVALSLSKTIKVYPAVGWIRARNIANDEVLADLNDLRKENISLREAIKRLEAQHAPDELHLAGLDESFDVRLTWHTSGRYGRTFDETISATWSEIFAVLGPSLVEHPIDMNANLTIAAGLYRHEHAETKAPYEISVVQDDFETIRVQLRTHGLIEVSYVRTTNGGMGLFLTITKKGERHLLQLRTVKSSK